MPQVKRLLYIAVVFCIGTTGFCISFFGLFASFFLLLTFLSSLVFLYSLYVYVRQQGLMSFAPGGIKNLMLEVSIFDILVNIFIYRKMSKMLGAVFSPFMKANTPEEARQILKNEAKVPAAVYKALF